MDKLNLPSIASSPKNISSLHNSPKLARKFKSGSPNNNINNNLNTMNNNTNTNLDWVKEETEWEQCSLNPEIARNVKTRNLLERNRLKTLNTQLDKQLERELKRLSIERQEFSDVLENLTKLHGKIEKLNVRSYKRKGFLHRDHEEPMISLFPRSLDKNKDPLHGTHELGMNNALSNEMRGPMTHVSSLPDLFYSESRSKYGTPAINIERSEGLSADRAEDEISVSVGSDTQSCRSQPISAYWAPYERSHTTNSASSNASSSSLNRIIMRKSWIGDKVFAR